MKTNNYTDFLRIAAFFLWALIAIAASAGAMNYAAVNGEGFYYIPGILNLLLNGFLIYREYKRRDNDNKNNGLSYGMD